MPEIQGKPRAAQRLKAICLVTAGVTVMGVYVGVPLAEAANAAVRAVAIDGVIAGSLVAGIGAVIAAVLVETSRSRKDGV